MTATDAQVRLIMKERSNGKTQEQAAVKANVRSRKTVQKYEQLGQVPSELKQARTHRTRRDPRGRMLARAVPETRDGRLRGAAGRVVALRSRRRECAWS